jgi:hypothetical protein
MKNPTRTLIALCATLLTAEAAWAQNEEPVYLKDRGTGLPTSMFGTYINKGYFYVYPFYEYYVNKDEEYAPNEFGGTSDEDIRGKYTGHEGLIFLSYGFTDKLAIEFEAAYMKARLERGAEDPEAPNTVVEESGIGDVEGQVRYRWNKETARSPEYFSYFETVLPLQKNRELIGTSDWEFKLGSGMIKGFRWGTVTLRAAIEYNGEEDKFETGEFALEYLKRVSKFFRFYLGVEGTQDEVEFITDLQFHVSQRTFVRVNNAFGLTSKAVDYGPELGVVFRF